MPNYSFHHVHHETQDVPATIEFYKQIFGATADEPVDKEGVLWGLVDLGNTRITVTNRESAVVDLGRLRGLDHFALWTDDFDATVEHINTQGASIWMGPLSQEGRRIVFINGPDNVKIELIEKK